MCQYCKAFDLELDADGNPIEHYILGSGHVICRGAAGFAVEYRMPDRTRIAIHRRDMYEVDAAPAVLDLQRGGRMVLVTRADLG